MDAKVSPPACSSPDQGTSALYLAPTATIDIVPKLDVDATGVAAPAPTSCSTDGLSHNTDGDDHMAAWQATWSVPTSFTKPLEVSPTEACQLSADFKLDNLAPTECSMKCFVEPPCALTPMFIPEVTESIKQQGHVLRPLPWPSFIGNTLAHTKSITTIRTCMDHICAEPAPWVVSKPCLTLVCQIELVPQETRPPSEDKALVSYNSISFAFRDAKPDEYNREHMGKEMAAYLQKFPLATKMIAKMLYRKRDYQFWVAILGKLHHVGETTECEHHHLVSLLKICYDELPAPSRLCFQYCSLLPNNWTFRSVNLVQLWMSQGFLVEQRQSNSASDEVESVEDVGKYYFGDLCSRSFFEKLTDDGHTCFYRMHTSVQCFAQVIAGEEFMRIESDIPPEKSLHVTHLSVKSTNLSALHKVDALFRLRTLIIFGPLSSDASEILQHVLPSLRNSSVGEKIYNPISGFLLGSVELSRLLLNSYCPNEAWLTYHIAGTIFLSKLTGLNTDDDASFIFEYVVVNFCCFLDIVDHMSLFDAFLALPWDSGHQTTHSRKCLDSTALTGVVMVFARTFYVATTLQFCAMINPRIATIHYGIEQFELQRTVHWGGSVFIEDELQWNLTPPILHMGSCCMINHLELAEVFNSLLPRCAACRALYIAVAVHYMDDKQLPWDPGDSLSPPAAHVLMLMALNNVGAFNGTRVLSIRQCEDLVQRMNVPWDPGGSTWRTQFPPSYNQSLFKEGGVSQLWSPLSTKSLLATSTSSDVDQVSAVSDDYLDDASFDLVQVYFDKGYHYDYTNTEERQVPYDSGGNSSASACGQAEFQGGRSVSDPPLWAVNRHQRNGPNASPWKPSTTNSTRRASRKASRKDHEPGRRRLSLPPLALAP